MKSYGKLAPMTIEEEKTFNEQIRHLFIVHMYKSIKNDLAVCEIRGWDKTEFIRMIQEAINHFKV